MSVYVVYRMVERMVKVPMGESAFGPLISTKRVFLWKVSLITENEEEATKKAASYDPAGVIVEQPERRARGYRIRRTPGPRDEKTRYAEDMSQCTIPPPGWWCSREPGHDGPCAARPRSSDAQAKVVPDEFFSRLNYLAAEMRAYGYEVTWKKQEPRTETDLPDETERPSG